jgi:hypothetical protein
VRWAEKGESSTSFFFKSRRKNRARNAMHIIKKHAGIYVNTTAEVLEAWQGFYYDLFHAEQTDLDIQNSLLRNLERHLDLAQSSSCEGLLTEKECLKALKGMSRNKTPGVDGLPMEFYDHFWHILGKDVVYVLNFGYTVGRLFTSQSRGIITLVPKNGDLRERKNWRRITLLNIDCKIASRAISGRLLKVLSNVISPDEMGSVPGRFIGETVLRLQNVTSFASTFDIPSAIISLDQKKAFDRVDWPFFFHTCDLLRENVH